MAADEAWLARVPDALPLDRAAGVPLVALTGWQALQQARPQAGQRCLVNAAAGGVGHITVQLAKALGLHVTGVCGPANLEFVKGLGADEVRAQASAWALLGVGSGARGGEARMAPPAWLAVV